MKTIEITTTLKIYQDINQMPDIAIHLMEKAIEMRQKAYAPYSNFKVGTAILMANGEIVLGSNQENAAYPSGLCAERVAIFQAGALYPNIEIEKIAISATSSQKPLLSPIPPCGACRQTIAEYEFKQKKPIEIYFMGESGEIYVSSSLQNLLPFSFDKNFL